MSKMENVKIVAKKRMWTIFVMLFYLLFDIICIFGFISDWDSTMFCVALIISIVLFPMLIHKIFSPKEILLFDNENKMFVVNKMFKSIKLPLENILSYYFNIKYSNRIFIYFEELGIFNKHLKGAKEHSLMTGLPNNR